MKRNTNQLPPLQPSLYREPPKPKVCGECAKLYSLLTKERQKSERILAEVKALHIEKREYFQRRAVGRVTKGLKPREDAN